MEAHLRGRYRALPFIASPLEQEGGHQRHHSHQSNQSINSENDLKSAGGHVTEIAVIRDDTPAFREKEEASTIELFYDLFFVANLTSFTNVHAIDDRKSKSFLSFLSFVGQKTHILTQAFRQKSHHTLDFSPFCGSPGCK